MSKDISLKHYVRQYIIDQLSRHDSLRFRELRPPKTDTNLVAYHAGVLRDAGVIEQHDDEYRLGPQGVRVVRDMRMQAGDQSRVLRPEVEVWFVIQNGEGDILMQQRVTQPFLGSMSLPHGAVRATDLSVEAAARRISEELFQGSAPSLVHAGDCYVRVKDGENLATTTFVHVFRFNSDELSLSAGLEWARPHKLTRYRMTPGADEVMARTFFHDPFFFEEFEEDWAS